MSKSLTNIGNIDKFGEVIKQRLVEKYADDAIKLIQEAKQIEKAHNQYQKWVAELEKGNVEIIELYKKERTKLEDEDGYEFA